MMSKTRSAFLSLYAALTPALASAKCGNVDYSWGADALASAHDYAVTMMLYIVYLCYAVAGIVVIVRSKVWITSAPCSCVQSTSSRGTPS